MNAAVPVGRPWLLRLSGRDRPWITHGVLGILADADGEIDDIEQFVVRDRLTLDLLVRLPDAAGPPVNGSVVVDAVPPALDQVRRWAADHGLQLDLERVEATSRRADRTRHVVTVLADRLSAGVLAAVAGAIAGADGTIDRIIRLSRGRVTAYDFVVIVARPDEMRRALVEIAHDCGIDIAVQVGGLERRAKRLVVMDVDSTLIRDEVIELLADEAGVRTQVAEVTERAMAGDLDFEASLRARVRLLAGLDGAAVERARRRIRLTPGARTFVATLHRIGCVVAIISGGFTPFVDGLRAELGLDYAYACELGIADGRLTGEVVGPVVDRRRKADLLREIAGAEGIPLSQTVAVGDGANDLDMLAAAGLGVAFNAKPVVRRQADTTVSVPYLDAILFLLGIRAEDVDRAAEDGGGAESAEDGGEN